MQETVLDTEVDKSSNGPQGKKEENDIQPVVAFFFF